MDISILRSRMNLLLHIPLEFLSFPSNVTSYIPFCHLRIEFMRMLAVITFVVCSHLLTLTLYSRIFLHCKWKRYVPPKRRLIQDLHRATSQNTTFFIVTAVKASNRTSYILFRIHISRVVSSSTGGTVPERLLN
jgi:hypothetical protein